MQSKAFVCAAMTLLLALALTAGTRAQMSASNLTSTTTTKSQTPARSAGRRAIKTWVRSALLET